MTIQRLTTDNVRVEMSSAEFEKLQEILRCSSHLSSCAWHAFAVSVRQAITFALGANEAARPQH